MEDITQYQNMDVYELLDNIIEADDWNHRTELTLAIKTQVGQLLEKLIIEQRRTIQLLEGSKSQTSASI
ncbi:MAG: hypothetical protein WBA74_27365 [Cyclobacteriaceae bacterium]